MADDRKIEKINDRMFKVTATKVVEDTYSVSGIKEEIVRLGVEKARYAAMLKAIENRIASNEALLTEANTVAGVIIVEEEEQAKKEETKA